jgi:hypothetical protein
MTLGHLVESARCSTDWKKRSVGNGWAQLDRCEEVDSRADLVFSFIFLLGAGNAEFAADAGTRANSSQIVQKWALRCLTSRKGTGRIQGR